MAVAETTAGGRLGDSSRGDERPVAGRGRGYEAKQLFRGGYHPNTGSDRSIMCGIAGVFDPTDAPDEELLRRMNDCQTHRGPDDSGVYRDGPVGFAHRRLSVIGLESGRQPIFNEDG